MGGVTIVALHDAADEIVGFAKISRDATEVRTLAEELRCQRDRLAETIEIWKVAKVVADEAKALAGREKVTADEAKALAVEAK